MTSFRSEFTRMILLFALAALTDNVRNSRVFIMARYAKTTLRMTSAASTKFNKVVVVSFFIIGGVTLANHPPKSI